MKRIKLIGVMFSLAVIFLVGVQYNLISSNMRFIKETHELHENSQQQKQFFYVFKMLLEVETGTRGYVLTGDPVFREPFENAKKVLPIEVEKLRPHVTTEQFEKINQLISNRVESAQNLINKKNANLKINATDLQVGKNQMDAIRGEFDKIEQESDIVLHEKTSNMQSSSEGINNLVFAGALFSLVIVFGCAAFLYQEFLKRMEAQKALSLSLATSEAITNNLGQGVLVSTHDGVVLYANEIALSVRQLTFEEMKKKSLDELFEKVEIDKDYLKSLFHTDKSIEETIVTYSTGVKRTVRVNFSPLMLKGKSEGVVITFFDISKEAESISELTTGKETADSASKAKSEFLAKMSHEIRTPLNAILGVGEILNMTNLTAEQKKCMDIYQRSSQTLINLVNDILDLSKIEAGKIELNPVPFSLKNLVDTCTSIMDFRASQRGLLFNAQVMSNFDHFIGDEGRIRQIVINLLGNAIKFTEQGSIILTVTCVDRGTSRKELIVSVKDTGRGIAPENIDKLFSNYSQESSKIASEFGGTGLGLSLSRELAHLMGGDITVRSVLGKGSEFILTCHVESMAGDFENESTPKGKVHKNLKILLVDDNPENRFIVKRFLDGSEVFVSEVGDGDAAVEKFKTDKFDMIFMDINMPIKDGIDATKDIRKYEKDHHLPKTLIIALSANALSQEYDRAMEAGCDDYLTKPLARGKLLATIEKWQEVEIANEMPMDEEIRAAVPMYLENRKKDLEEMKALFAARDDLGIKKIAHKIAGTAENYGQIQLGKTASIMEQSCKDNDWEEIEKCLLKIEHLLKT